MTKGDKQDMGEVYRRYAKELTHYVAGKFGCNAVESEDVVQTAFTKFAALPDAHVIENPRAFLYKTASNVALDGMRRASVRERCPVAMHLVTEHANVADPERKLAAAKRLQALAAALETMPATRRKFLLLSRLDNLSNVEIARRFGISEGAVRKHIAKALRDCKEAVD